MNLIDEAQIGDIYLAYEGTKVRPVLIASDGLGIDIDVNIARVTSQKQRSEFDVLLKHWKEAGLTKLSVVRCSKTNFINSTNLISKIGELNEDDYNAVFDKIIEFNIANKERGKKRYKEVEKVRNQNKPKLTR